ncbi:MULTISPECIES: IS66 family transposase [Mesorhizobium]|uniref:IS66 family transposase n=1 Tax=Mesorhizobium TaxID=68287 RepID=UPI001FD87D9F|nr:IS66 family transposase [Mesorhizobium sp. WSM3873]
MARHLAGFSGILQVDGYSANTNLVKARAKAGSNETIRLAGCWAHLRRKILRPAHQRGLAGRDGNDHRHDRIVEGRGRGSHKGAGSRAALRKEKSVAIVASLFDLGEAELDKVSGKSKTAEAIRYAPTRREALERFLMDGRIEIDSNIVERAFRPRRSRERIVYSPAATAVDEPGRRWPPCCKPAK